MPQFNWPPISISASPQQFVLNGNPTQVSRDTGTPINSRPLPVELFTEAGTPADFSTGANQTTANATLAAIKADLDTISANTPAPVNGASPVQQIANPGGVIKNAALTATNASAEPAPAKAVGFVIAADTDNADHIRWCLNDTASPVKGMRLEPGRDSGFIPCSGNLSICAMTSNGTNNYAIQWVLTP